MMTDMILDDVLPDVQFLASPHFDDRPDSMAIDLLVIHCISLPPSQFGNQYVEDFFLGKLDNSAHPYFHDIAAMRVSAHIYIKRDGHVVQFVPLAKRAWHAGLSQFETRERCNDFSVGIELEGDVDSSYTDDQYTSLVSVTKQIQLRCPLITNARITGHSDIAPQRKQDPGPSFDWQRYLKQL